MNGSTNFIIPNDQLKKLSGENRHWQRKGVSGKEVQYTFCSTCSTLMKVEADAFPGMSILKPGTIDDRTVLDSSKPVQEIFTKDRPEWCTAIDGAGQKEIA